MRGQHYTSNTVSVDSWCNRCRKFTPHQVSAHVIRHCIPCAEKQQELQQFLFARSTVKSSALDGRTPLLFSDTQQRVMACLFCGNTSEGRSMCSKCRRKPLGEIFWIVRAK